MARPTRAEFEARLLSLERAARRREKLLGALRASEARYRALIERSDDLILTCRLDGTITEVNQAAASILGRAPDRVIGRKLATILTPASLAAVAERVRRAVTGERLPRIFSAPAPRKRPMRCTCSATSRLIPTGSMPRAARVTIVRPWRSPSRAGKRDEAGERLTAAAMMYRDMDVRFWLTQAEAESSEVR